MNAEERRLRYLYERHSVEEVRQWNTRLRYFRYFRAYGGHANDADSLDAAVQYRGQEDLLLVLTQLGLEPLVLTAEPEQMVPGMSYTHAEYERLPKLVPGTRWVVQPGHVQLHGVPVHVWAYGDRVLLSLQSKGWEVDEEVICTAERLEPYLDALAGRMMDPPRDTDHYLCAVNYPELGRTG